MRRLDAAMRWLDAARRWGGAAGWAHRVEISVWLDHAMVGCGEEKGRWGVGVGAHRVVISGLLTAIFCLGR